MTRTPLELLNANAEWAASVKQSDANFFESQLKGQAPRYFWLGCADSRVPVDTILQAVPGEVFVHQNVANLFRLDDTSALATLEIAVDILSVTDVIVCGHYGCAGVAMAMENSAPPRTADWIEPIRSLCRADEGPNDPQAAKRLVERNVVAQILNIGRSQTVESAWGRQATVNLHGWVYDLETGRLSDLAVSASNSEQLAQLAAHH